MQTWQESKQSETEYRMPLTSEEILGVFLKDLTLFTETKRKLTPAMFGGEAWLYSALYELDEINALSFKALLLKHPDKAEYMSELRSGVASTSVLPYLIEELKRKNLAMELYNLSQDIGKQVVTEGRDPNEILGETQARINGMNNTESGEPSDPDKDVDEFYEWMDEIIADPSKAYGLMTGIDDLDRMTTGFHREDFIVVGARSSIGKSAFMIEVTLRLAKNGYKVGIFSLEMSKKQIYLRMLANLMTVELEILKTGRLIQGRIPEMKKHREFLKQIYVDDTRGISAEYITGSMRQLKRTRGLDCVMVDYLQDVKEIGEQNDNGGSALARICRKLRTAAKECNVAMIGLSQVARGVEDRKDKRPMMSDLSGSTGIETSADVIAMLYRDDYYDPNTELQGIMEINFAKQRNAAVGKVELYYERSYQQLRPKAGRRY